MSNGNGANAVIGSCDQSNIRSWHRANALNAYGSRASNGRRDKVFDGYNLSAGAGVTASIFGLVCTWNDGWACCIGNVTNSSNGKGANAVIGSRDQSNIRSWHRANALNAYGSRASNGRRDKVFDGYNLSAGAGVTASIFGLVCTCNDGWACSIGNITNMSNGNGANAVIGSRDQSNIRSWHRANALNAYGSRASN